jgi:hypothetical protein
MSVGAEIGASAVPSAKPAEVRAGEASGSENILRVGDRPVQAKSWEKGWAALEKILA